MRYDEDILTAPSHPAVRYPEVEVDTSMAVVDRASGFAGRVVRWGSEGVTLQSERDHVRHFTWKPGGFVVAGRPVTLVRPTAAPAMTQRITASGSFAGDGRARVAVANRIWVEGRHDAELIEQVWGDDLRDAGVVVEPMHGADDVVSAVRRFEPGADRRLGILLDHLVDGSKEARLASAARHPHVLVAGHPFVDVWAGIRPSVIGLDEWPDIPRRDAQGAPVEWKAGLCAALGVDPDGFWPRLRNRVSTFADLRPELVGAVERLIDFVTDPPSG
jgi:hypothetical protein